MDVNQCDQICQNFATLQIVEVFGNSRKVHFVIAKILNLLWPIFNAIGQMLIVENN